MAAIAILLLSISKAPREDKYSVQCMHHTITVHYSTIIYYSTRIEQVERRSIRRQCVSVVRSEKVLKAVTSNKY